MYVKSSQEVFQLQVTDTYVFEHFPSHVTDIPIPSSTEPAMNEELGRKSSIKVTAINLVEVFTHSLACTRAIGVIITPSYIKSSSIIIHNIHYLVFYMPGDTIAFQLYSFYFLEPPHIISTF